MDDFWVNADVNLDDDVNVKADVNIDDDVNVKADVNLDDDADVVNPRVGTKYCSCNGYVGCAKKGFVSQNWCTVICRWVFLI